MKHTRCRAVSLSRVAVLRCVYCTQGCSSQTKTIHVLSSEDNAKKMVTKINEGGFPAFTEVFGSKKNLHAVYVGPFIEESDINQNIELIQKVSESQNGEISRWKL